MKRDRLADTIKQIGGGWNENVSRDVSASTIPVYAKQVIQGINEITNLRHSVDTRNMIALDARESTTGLAPRIDRDRPDFHPPANFPPLIGILGPVENSKPLIPTARTKTPIVDEGFERGTLIAFVELARTSERSQCCTLRQAQTSSSVDGTSHRGVARRIR